jgi:hypothetical protein
MLHHNDIDAEALQKLHLVFVRQKHLWRALGRKDFQRVRLERQHHGWSAELLSFRHGATDQSPVPQVYAVKVSQGDNRSFDLQTRVPDVAKNLHI